jgi:hypothetical protein
MQRQMPQQQGCCCLLPAAACCLLLPAAGCRLLPAASCRLCTSWSKLVGLL